jgi:hypothetical protein
MRTLWMFHRRFIVAAALTVALATSAAVVLIGSRHNTAAVSSLALRGPGNGPTRSKQPATTTSRRCPPKTNVEPPATAIERQVDSELAQAETLSALAAAEAAGVPAPATSAAYPSIPVADRSDPTAYAIAFATQLLDTNYAAQTRAELLAWAEHEEAPNTLPGVPASVAGKSLVLSLTDPGLPGGTPSPTPSASQWASDAEEGATQSVDDVEAEVDPDWAQIIAEGWQPRDARMTIETVTGTVTLTTNGQAAAPESFSLTLTLGTAAHVPAGYGAVAAGDWTVD